MSLKLELYDRQIPHLYKKPKPISIEIKKLISQTRFLPPYLQLEFGNYASWFCFQRHGFSLLKNDVKLYNWYSNI